MENVWTVMDGQSGNLSKSSSRRLVTKVEAFEEKWSGMVSVDSLLSTRAWAVMHRAACRRMIQAEPLF